jgi:hypothetical protein
LGIYFAVQVIRGSREAAAGNVVKIDAVSADADGTEAARNAVEINAVDADDAEAAAGNGIDIDAVDADADGAEGDG